MASTRDKTLRKDSSQYLGGRESLWDQPDNRVHIRVEQQLPGLTYATTRKASSNGTPSKLERRRMPYPTRVARPRRVPTSSVEDALGGSTNSSPAPFSLSRGRLEVAPLHPADYMLVEAVQRDSDAACTLVRDVQPAPAHCGNHKRHRAS